MPKCPHCNYELTLLERRRKYKCSKCSKLFPQIEIETKDFVEFNKRQRKLDEEALTEQKLKQLELDKFVKKQAQIQRKAKMEELRPIKFQEYYKLNKEKILAKQKIFRHENGQRINLRHRILHRLNIEERRQLSRINAWRNKNRLLTADITKNGLFSFYNTESDDIMPTSSLSYLL